MPRRNEALDPAQALRFLGALILSVAGWTIPWNLPQRTWYDILGLACCLGAVALWCSLYRVLGNVAAIAVVVLGLRLAAGVIANDTFAPIGNAYYRAFGVVGVVIAITIIRIATLPAVVSWFRRMTRIRR